MLTASQIKVNLDDPQSVVDVVRYYAPEKYYAKPGEAPGVWFGQGATHLGLAGVVSGKVLRRLLLGKSPDGKRQLVKVRQPKPKSKLDGQTESKAKTKKDPELHVPGFDLTFSVPKSISTLWALSDERVRRLIEQAIDESVRETITWFESDQKLARRGKGGRHHDYAKLVVAMFDHKTARNALDPALHRHCVVLNLCQNLKTGKWSKVNSQVVFRWFRTLGPMFRNTLLQKLDEKLGVEAYRPEVDGKPAAWFELRGVLQRLVDKWSSRRKEILAVAELSNGKVSTARARANANRRTRKSKGTPTSQDELDRKWTEEAKALGVTRESVQAALGRRTQHDIEERMKGAIREAIKVCHADRAYFSRHKFIQAVSEALQDVPISGVEVALRADLALQRQALFHKIETKQSQEPVYTTQSMWKLEQKLLSTVASMKQSQGAIVSAKQIDRVLQKYAELTGEQSKATRHLLESSGAIKCLTGVAGAGKTKTLNAMREAYELAGFKVIGTALSGAAKEELAAKANIETRTVASYEYHWSKPARVKFMERLKHEIRMFCRAALGKSTWQKASVPKLDKKSVLFIDEAGMLDTKSMSFLVQTAKKTGATLLLVGDPKQLNPIGPGGPFKNIINSAPTSHLSENFRQKHAPEDAQAAADLREGRAEKMLESYLRRGRLTVAKNRTEAARKLVTTWSKDGNAKRPEEAIILTQTREEARQINRLCQMERKLDGRLGQRSVQLPVERHVETFHVGDRVMFHEPFRRKGIENGFQATITAIHPVSKAITFRLDRDVTPQQKKLGHTQTVTLKPGEIGPKLITLGYAATTHKMQAQSRVRAYCLMGGQLTNQELAYVQITRGEMQTKLFIDRDHAGPKLTELAKTLKTSGEKKLAHDLGLRLRIQKDKGDQT